MARPATATIPVFKLYGETAAWPTPDLIHCESIPERSKMHEWEIKPHRHGDLVQLLYVQSGRAMLKVEDVVTEVETPSLQVVPALSVHTFRFAEDIQGHILSLAKPLVEQLETALDSSAMRTTRCYELGADSHYVDTLFSAIAREYRQPRAGRDLMLHSLINVLVHSPACAGHGHQRRAFEFAVSAPVQPVGLADHQPAAVAGGQAQPDLHHHDHQSGVRQPRVFRTRLFFALLQTRHRAVAQSVSSAEIETGRSRAPRLPAGYCRGIRPRPDNTARRPRHRATSSGADRQTPAAACPAAP